MPLQAKKKLVILRMCAEGLLHAVGYTKAGDRKTMSKTCGQSYKHFMLVNYDSRLENTPYYDPRLENTPYYDPRVVIYERKCFIRLATGLLA